MTEMLTLQAAISLENAALFDERRKTEEALRQSELKFRTVADFTYGWEYWITPDGRFVYVSPSCTRLTGYSPQEFINDPKLLEKIIYEKDKDSVNGNFEKFDSREPHNVDFRIIRRDGEVRWIAHVCQAVFASDGQMLGRRASNRDITIRKQAEEALRKNEQRWATTLESIGDAVIASDTLGKITFMNAVAEELTGWTLREANQRPVKEVFKIINEFSRKEVEDPVSKVLEKGMIVGLANHTVLIRKDDTEVPIDDSGAPIRDEKGKITGVVLVFRDITERKQAEEALRESVEREHFLAELIRNASVAVGVGYPDGRLGMVNAAFQNLTGYSQEELPKISWNKVLTPPEYFVFEEAKLSELHRTKKPVRYEKEYVRKDGSRVPIELVVHPFFDKEGNVAHYFSFITDMTERKKAEQELWKAKNDWERTFDSVPDLIAILDDKHRIVRANQAMAEALGSKPEKCVGLNCYTCVHGANRPPDFCPHSKALKDGKEHVEEVHEDRLGGDFLVSATPLVDELGLMVGSVHVARDITVRKQMEKKLEEYSKHLEQLVEERTKQLKDSERLAAIGATAGMVGHDIRNPLQAMTSDVFLVKSDLASLPESEEKESMQESLDYIEKNIEYINKIVADLQDYARPLKPKAELIDLENIINELLLKQDMPENIKAVAEISSEAKKMMSDPTCLKRVLGNLILNAIQAMPEGGTLSVLACKEVDDTVITVADTGVGIPDEVKAKMFTPMLTTKSKGQGFGLPVVKRMVEALNGSVTFESEAGKGTTFRIRFSPTKIKDK